MARYRVGPVRFGGGRKVSVGIHAGPVGVTFGGRRRRSGGSGGGPSYRPGDDGPSAAEERQQQREMERMEREYQEWYATLTPSEQLFEDRRKWEDWDSIFVGQNDGSLIQLRWGLFMFTLVEFVLVLILFNGAWLQSSLAILGACGLNHWSVKNFPAYKSLRSVVLGLSPRDYWLRWSVIFLISSLSVFIGPFKGAVALIGFGLVVWSAWRFVNLREISNEILNCRNLFEELNKNGVINEDNLYQVWKNLNNLLIISANFEESNYFRIDRLFSKHNLARNASNIKVKFPRPVIKFDSANPRRRRRKPSAGDSE
jgi:hypothetical protein